MDSSLKEQLEASFRNQMDASDASYYEAGRRGGGGAASGGANPGAASPAANWNNQPPEFSREQLLEQIINPYFEDDSPAAEALRANAQVHIGKMSKVARSINAQAIRKIVKRASMRSHFGKVRGKPPRVPPPSQMGEHTDGEIPDMYGIEEGDYEEEDDGKIPAYSGGSGIPPGISEDSAIAGSEDHSLVQTNSGEGQANSRSKHPSSPRNRDVVEKESPPIISQHPGDHLHYSLTAMKKSQPSMKSFATDGYGQQKDIPAEVVEGTMEAGRKGMIKEALLGLTFESC